jgi:hypothetical protein
MRREMEPSHGHNPLFSKKENNKNTRRLHTQNTTEIFPHKSENIESRNNYDK